MTDVLPPGSRRSGGRSRPSDSRLPVVETAGRPRAVDGVGGDEPASLRISRSVRRQSREPTGPPGRCRPEGRASGTEPCTERRSARALSPGCEVGCGSPSRQSQLSGPLPPLRRSPATSVGSEVTTRRKGGERGGPAAEGESVGRELAAGSACPGLSRRGAVSPCSLSRLQAAATSTRGSSLRAAGPGCRAPRRGFAPRRPLPRPSCPPGRPTCRSGGTTGAPRRRG